MIQTSSSGASRRLHRRPGSRPTSRICGLISSDPHPDPAMYEVSVADAVTSGVPTVIAFATPGFCASATCGPLLDQVKALQSDYPEVEFIHVEIYEDLSGDRSWLS